MLAAVTTRATSPGVWTNYWYEAAETAGTPWFQIKDLRRHYGITLSENGAEMHVIQAALGHCSVATTESYYAHFSPNYAARRAFTILEGRGRVRLRFR